MIIDCISDQHGYYPELEGGDLLIVAGDLTARDEIEQYKEFSWWLRKQKYQKVIIVAGNHDNELQNNLSYFTEYLIDESRNYIQYLCDSGTEFDGLKIWGSPWTLKFKGQNPKAMAFTCDTEKELAEKWNMIPEDTKILITHSPGYAMRDGRNSEQRLGSRSLTNHIVRSGLFDNLKLHVSGHIHEGYGKYDIRKLQQKLGDKQGCVYVNASHVNERYEPVNKPVRVIL